jgi:ATP-dependent DNA helicase RecG
MILEYVKAHGWIARHEVVELCKIGPYQATRLLKRLVEEGKLVRYGVGKGTRYALRA